MSGGEANDRMVPSPSSGLLSAGIVAHNEESHLRPAIHSLVKQTLPEGIAWGDIWVVASGCTDRTVEVAQQLSAEDPRVHVLVENERHGKAHALNAVFQRARGDALLLLNADASAEPGAVAALVRAGAERPAPYAIMGRPVLGPEVSGAWAGPLRSMWALHHEFHLELQRLGGGAHLSDELLLLSLPNHPGLPEGIINDGSYFGVWLAQRGGPRVYAPDARVRIDVPRAVSDHLLQRRRIIFGNSQVKETLGAPPSTLVRYALRSPRRALGVVRRTVATEENGLLHLAWLVVAEATAIALAAWDRLPPKKDHVRWRRIGVTEPQRSSPGTPEGEPSPAPSGVSGLEQRVSTVLRVAEQFGDSVPLPDLLRLLPGDSPATIPEVRDWLRSRPDLGEVDEEHAYVRSANEVRRTERIDRGIRYMRSAESLFAGRLRGTLPFVRCACVTGSTAYGAPELGDDLDFLVVVQSGSLWWFVARTYLALRLARLRRQGGTDPTPCFNLVLDEGEARSEYERNRGFLVAREALVARPVHGLDYYRALLSCAGWMEQEIPRLYSEQNPQPRPHLPPPSAAPRFVRALNAVSFPLVAAYLQCVGLLRDHQFRRRGQNDHRFRTVTQLRRLAFASQKFEHLRESYRHSPARPPGSARYGAAGAR